MEIAEEKELYITYAFPVTKAAKDTTPPIPWDPMKTRVCDISRWQGDVNFIKMASQGIEGVCMRATVGNYYTDPKFETYWRDAGKAGLLRSAYHVVAPADSYGNFISAEKQMNRFISIFGSRISDFPIVMDCELSRGQTAETITNVIKKCCDIAVEHYGDVMIYTSPGFWNGNVRRRGYWSEFPLWDAHYTTAKKPLLPADWSDWQMWQWTSKGDGKQYGVSSGNIDLNRVHYQDFLGNIPPSNGGNGETEMDINQVIKDWEVLDAKGIPVSVFLNVNYYELEPSGDDNGNGGTPPPPADDTVFVQVTDDKAVAHFISGLNAKDKPIMEIYPSESSPASERIVYKNGEKVEVWANQLSKDDVDGQEGFWGIYKKYGDNGEHLFLQESKVAKV